MKKYTRIFALTLAVSMMLLCGCNFNKTYETVEEWYDDNPALSTFINMGIEAEEDGDDMTFFIEDNNVIYSVVLEEAMFGESAEMDQLYKDFFDESFDAEEATYTDIISDMAELSGIPESSITVSIEIYNPGATTPSYTKTFTK